MNDNIVFDLDECQLKVDQDMFDLELGEFYYDSI